jgi:hypothetical protein
MGESRTENQKGRFAGALENPWRKKGESDQIISKSTSEVSK